MFILYILAGLYFVSEIVDNCLWWFRDWDEMKKRWDAVWAVPPKPEKTLFIDNKGYIFDKNADYALNLVSSLWYDKRRNQGLLLIDDSILTMSNDEMIKRIIAHAKAEPCKIPFYRDIIITYFDPKFDGLQQ